MSTTGIGATPMTRRRFLRTGLVLPAGLAVAACGLGRGASSPTTEGRPSGESVVTDGEQPTRAPTTIASSPATLEATPACDDGDDPTPDQTAGPFFIPESPERTSLLEPGVEGTRLVLSGAVLSTGCEPVAGALLDFWQADAAGEYDNQGYRLRGHQFADALGGYRLETVVPGNYVPRTRHIHVRVQAPDHPVLTTQLYFPGEPGNESDGIFDPRLLMAIEDLEDHREAGFTFVLDLG